MLIEVLFFFLGVLPYWYTLYLPVKSKQYWGVLIWCCLVWLCYFGYHQATAAVLNNIAELFLATLGFIRYRLDVR